MTDKKHKILKATLAHIPFDGWSLDVLRLGAKESGYEEVHAEIAFAGGVDEAIKLFLETYIDMEMMTRYEANAANYKGVAGKIKCALLCRLNVMEKHKEVVRKTVQYLSNPLHAALSLSVTYKTVDDIWYMIGDKTSDFNFYTKRITLAGVYSSTLLFWLQDESENYTQTEAFLDRRLANVMQIGKARKSIKEKLSKVLSMLPVKFG